MTVDCATGDNPDDARWLEANRRLKMLAERAILHGDHHATREIETLLQGQILRLAVSVNEPHLRQEVAANLGAHAFEVIHRKFQQADLLLAYVQRRCAASSATNCAASGIFATRCRCRTGSVRPRGPPARPRRRRSCSGTATSGARS